MAPVHLDGVTAFEREVFRERDPWPRAAFEAEIANPAGLWLAAVEGGRVAGYGGGWCVPPEFQLLNLCVAPPDRRRGVAAALVGEVSRRARERGCTEIVLEVREDNTPALALYRKLGFERIHARPRYYAGGGNAVVMRRAGEAA